MDPMIIIYALKVVKVATSYISLTVTANYMGQIYMDKVLVNQENPQHLTNFITMFAILDLLMFSLCLGIFFGINTVVPGFNLMSNLSLLIQDYMIGLTMICISGLIVAIVMYNKKYFMYKDDGLRGIRGLKDIMLG